MKKIIRRETTESTELATFPPILQRILSARGITDKEMVDLRLNQLINFNGLTDVDKAVERIATALENNERICFVGDFDADGATSTAVGVSVLKAFCASHVDYIVPNRFEYGYGLSPEIVEVAKHDKNPDLIITVDNGISSFEGVLKARELGIDVVITDHHLSAGSLPDAIAVVNPNRPDCEFASKGIAGVGVIFYVMLALRRYLTDNGYFANKGISPPNMASFLDLVALGTVADVVPLEKNNRILVHEGLKRIKQGQARPGILALLKIAKRDYQHIQALDLGFAVAPRLNAAGRLDDMSLGIECLLTDDESDAREKANTLDLLNSERREIEQDMKLEASKSLAQLQLNDKALPLGLCLYDESFHQGVIGIVAGRLKERYHRPVIVFAKADEESIKGSARSIPSIHIRDLLDEIAKAAPEVMDKFGGHAMAAGMSLKLEHFKQFKQLFEQKVAEKINESDCVSVLYSDGELSGSELSMDTVRLIQSVGPYGQQFPEPLFDNTFELIEQRLLKEQHLKMTLRDKATQVLVDAIAFNVGNEHWPNHRLKEVHVAYRLDVNRYMGREKLQLIVEHIEGA